MKHKAAVRDFFQAMLFVLFYIAVLGLVESV